MTPTDYELVAQIGAGPDGVSFRARRVPDGRAVEFRTLAAARGDDVHWPRLAQRLRLARLLDQPGARRVLDMDLDADPPWLAVEFADGPPLPRALEGRLPLPAAEALAFATYLAAVLHAAHRLGLAHGSLSPDAVIVTAHPPLLVDFTGAATRETQTRIGPSSVAQFSDDIAALGGVCAWLLSGQSVEPGKELPGEVPGAARGVLGDMLSLHADNRPSLGEAESRLGDALRAFVVESDLATTRLADLAAAGPRVERPPDQLGRFRLEEKLGAGGMGEVWRARDTSDGRVVAVKTLLPEHTRNPAMLKRFQKEARLLAEVNNPYVANLLDVNEDGGVHYLAVEYVPGRSAAALLDEKGALDEGQALAIAADVCQALAIAHGRGVVHRDIKPDNILLLGGPASDQVAKLSDFGLARHVVESESLHLTRTGSIVGTPLYLSPEQCRGDPVDPRSDVYSLGATLFHLLAGRPPFTGDGPMAVLQAHLNAPVPSLKAINASLSDGVCRVVERAMAKSPAHRPADAAELLAEIERVRRGEPSAVTAHPRLPDADPARVLTYDFSWELESPPEELWPHVSNTERLNRAIHLAAVPWATSTDENGRVRRHGQIKAMGVEVGWEEHPFEWVEGRRFGVLREMTSGPFRWFVSVVELAPRPGGTTLTHRLRLEPTGVVGRAVAAVQVGFQTRRALERVYRRIDAVLRGKAGAFADPFEEPASLTGAQQRRLDEGLDRLARHGVDPRLVERLGTFLATGPPQEVARIRPLALARRLGFDGDAVVTACLHAAREGLLALLWDLLCPLCRIPSEIKDTLKALKDHGHCEACNADYELDFARSVELIFRAAPTIREAELGVYCIGGPAHSPHVAAQLRVAPGERVELELSLAAGAYRLRGPQLPAALELRVEPGPHPTRWEVDLARMADKGVTFLRPGGQVLAMVNPHAQELVVRLERTAQRDDALTAARVSALALFRELFPGEVLSPGRLVSVAAVTLAQTELTGLRQLAEREGDSRAFAKLHEHLRDAEAVAKLHGGALVKAVGDGALLAFPDPARALRAALALEPDRARRLALHRGSALAATINDQLDYFGATVRETAAILEMAKGGERLVSQAVMDDPAVSALLRAGGVSAELRRAGGLVVHVVGA
jgi:serine/threonine protein kinase/class 3 adenylate cyclase